ncbi:MAG: hypothetical protein RIT81_04045 [Deltaproteobacteria bacterium]
MRTHLFALLAGALLCGCSDDTDNLGDDDGNTTPPACLMNADAAFTTSAAVTSNADVLFVIDDSSSMGEVQARLREAFGAFVDEVYGTGRVRVAVTTTDVNNDPPLEGDASVTYSANYPHAALTTDRNGCAVAGVDSGCFRGPDPATRILDTDNLTAAQMVAGFDANADVGTCGSGDEQGLSAALLALENDGSGGCNTSFLRGDADLVLVFVSDEDDGTREPIDQVLEGLRMHHPLPAVRVAVLGGFVDGEPLRCRAGSATCGTACDTPPPPGSQMSCMDTADCPAEEVCRNSVCESMAAELWDQGLCWWCGTFATADCCEAIPASRYLAFAQSLEARTGLDEVGCRPQPDAPAACLAESLCEADLAPAMRRIARSLVLDRDDSDVRRSYPLPKAPTNVASVVVRIDGTVVAASAYTITGATIVLDDAITPGQSVEVFCLD